MQIGTAHLFMATHIVFFLVSERFIRWYAGAAVLIGHSRKSESALGAAGRHLKQTHTETGRK